jgi:hypothetical protein
MSSPLPHSPQPRSRLPLPPADPLSQVSWIYPPELFPLRLRGKAVAVTTASNWAFNFALSYFVPPAFENIKWKTYILFGVFNFAMTVHAFLCFPETSGKTLEDVEHMFLDSERAWKTKVQYGRVRELEAGHVDPEKRVSVSHHEVGGERVVAEEGEKRAVGATSSA